MSDSPNSLTRPKVKIAKLDSKILYIAVAIGVLLVVILIYAVNTSTGKNEKQAQNLINPIFDTDMKQPIPAPENANGLSIPQKKKEEKPPLEIEIEKTLVTVVRPKGPSEAEKQRVKELQEVRSFKLDRMRAALTAPLKVETSSTNKKQNQTVQTSFDDVRSRHPLTASGTIAGINGEPDERQEKEEFLNARAAQKDSWRLPYERVPGARCELKTGSVITGIMISGINSDLPGQIIGQVSKNIYDTATGTYMLIPQGSRMVGVYDSRVAVGQSRVLVAWNRIIFPDGSSITLGVMPGTDIGGYAGYSGDVDNHYLKTFGSAAIMSLISGGTAYAMDSFNKSSSSRQTPTLQDELGSAVASQLGQSTMQLLQMNVKLKPAISTEPGKRFNMVVTKDIVFARPYKPYRSQ